MDFGPSFSESVAGYKRRKGRRQQAEQRSSALLGYRLGWKPVVDWRWRMVPLACVAGLLLLSLGGRLWQLQIISGDEGRQASRNNSLAIELLPAARGIIYDRNGAVLASNEPAFRIAATYSRLPARAEERAEIVTILAKWLNMEAAEVKTRLEEAAETPFVPLTIKGHIDRDTEIRLLSVLQDLPGISIEQDLRRQYPYKDVFSHILGYTGSISQAELDDPLLKDAYYPGQDIGKTGLEKEYESELKGQTGKKFSQIDAKGLPQQASNEQSPIAGQDVTLSIDARLQEYVYKKMTEAMGKYGSKGASAIIQDLTNGEVLSLVSLPSYDNNLFAEGISNADYQSLTTRADNPLFDRVIAGTYPPGSTVKPLVGAGAVEDGVITAQTLIYSPNIISVGGSDYADWTYWIGRSGPGNINVITAIAQSTDTFFYQIGGGYEKQKGMGVTALYKYFTQAGFGSLTGIDLPGEARGLVPNPAWKKSQFPDEPTWYLGNTYQLSIGQSYLLTTPLQINAMTSAIANNGVLLKPRVVSQIKQADGQTKKTGVEVLNSQIASKKGLDVARAGFRESVANGIIYPLRNNPMQVAAKTGTAEYGVRGDKEGYGTHAWVTGYAPYTAPKYSFTIMLENGASSNNSAEIADDILKWMMNNGF